MNLLQFLLVLKARKLIILLALVITVAATASVNLLLPPTYTATASLVIDFKGIDPVSGMPLPGQMLPGYMGTQANIIGSHNVALKVVDALKLVDSPAVREQFMAATDGKGSVRDWMADIILGYLKVEPSRESSIVELNYKGNDPQFVAALANAFAHAYITTNLELKVEPAKMMSTWFDGQIKSLRENLEQAQAKLSAYQREKGFVAVDERLDVENGRLNDLAAQLVAAQSQAYDSVSRQRQLNAAESAGRAAEALPEIIGNPLIQGMKAELARSESKLAEVSNRVGKNHPEYQRALAEFESIRKKIDAEVKNASIGIANNASISQHRELQLKNALAAQKAKILALSRERDEFAVLTRELDSAQRMLDAALQRSGQTRLESQANQTNIAILNPAVPPLKPSGPNIMRNLVISVFLGTLLGIGLGFLRELFDRRIRSSGDLADALGVPVLGVLAGAADETRKHFFIKLFKRPVAA